MRGTRALALGLGFLLLSTPRVAADWVLREALAGPPDSRELEAMGLSYAITYEPGQARIETKGLGRAAGERGFVDIVKVRYNRPPDRVAPGDLFQILLDVDRSSIGRFPGLPDLEIAVEVEGLEVEEGARIRVARPASEKYRASPGVKRAARLRVPRAGGAGEFRVRIRTGEGALLAEWILGEEEAPATPGTPLETVEVPNDAPVVVETETVFTEGLWYVLEASGVVSDWAGKEGGVDAAWCYAPWRCAPPLKWMQLRIDDRTLEQLGGREVPYSADHVYRIRFRGEGRPLSLYMIDAVDSHDSNSGAITVKFFGDPARTARLPAAAPGFRIDDGGSYCWRNDRSRSGERGSGSARFRTEGDVLVRLEKGKRSEGRLRGRTGRWGALSSGRRYHTECDFDPSGRVTRCWYRAWELKTGRKPPTYQGIHLFQGNDCGATPVRRR